MMLSCGRKTETKGIDIIDLRDVINVDPINMPLSDIASFMYGIPLETTRDVLLSDLNDIKMDDDYFYILSNNRCFIFDKSGKFIKTIGNRGGGPGEYARISQIIIKEKSIYLYDLTSCKILVFNKKGEFIRTITIPERLNNIALFGQEDFIGYKSNNLGNVPVKFYFFNCNGILYDSIPQTHTFESPTVTVSFSDECKFYDFNEKIYLKEYFNDTVFEANKDGVHARLFLELGDKRARPEGEARREFTIRDIWFKDMARIDIIGETNRFFFLESKGFIFYDKKEIISRKAKLTHDDFELSTIYLSTDNKIIISYQLMEDDNNPKLLIFKVKE